MKRQTSLRRKIIFGYYAIGTLIVGMALFAFVELRFIAGQTLAGERISEFFDTTLEIRRFEKNFFLYGQSADYEENKGYVAQARRLLEQNAADFAALVDSRQLVALHGLLDRYDGLMTEYARTHRADPSRGHALEQKIRKIGKEIVTIAEETGKNERRTLQVSLDRHRRNLIIFIIALTVSVVAIGQALSRMVARPLRQMEESMEAVAKGDMREIAIQSRDREIVSLTNAFNHVLSEMERRQAHLVRSEKMASLGTLLSGVAHELNNPLSNIMTSCQILQEELEQADPAFKKELLDQIDEQTVRARNIVRSLLDFARDREFKMEPTSLSLLIEETIRFLKGQIPTGVSVAVDVPPDLVVRADKQRLQQAFLNLLKNAVEAAAGAGEVTIRASRRPLGAGEPAKAAARFPGPSGPDEEAAHVEVRDSGSGIPPEVLPRIFDPFFTTKEVGKGSGLGLFIVYEIIEEHGGCISVESEPGRGTAFLIRLPLAKARHEDGSTGEK